MFPWPMAGEVSRGRAKRYFDDSIRSFIEVNRPLHRGNIMRKHGNEDAILPVRMFSVYLFGINFERFDRKSIWISFGSSFTLLPFFREKKIISRD